MDPALHSNPMTGFISKLVSIFVPKSLRDLMSFKTVDRVSHRLAEEVLEDMSVPDARGSAARTYVPGEQESATDPRVVRPPAVYFPAVDAKRTGIPEPSLRIIELELTSGPVEAEILVLNSRENEVKDVLLMISGNPGIVDFYGTFLSSVHASLGFKPALIGTGHIGHSTLLATPPTFTHSLPEQVEAKVLLVQRILEWYPAANIYIAGHSIGAWMASRVMAALESEPRLKGCYLLFPTLERIVETPNGQRQHRMFKTPFKQLLSSLVHSLRWALPMDALIELVAKLSHQPLFTAKITATRLLSYSTVLSALTMSDDEMRDVARLDSELFKRNEGRIRGYYSTRDAWVPVEHYHAMRKVLEPTGMMDRMELDKYQLPHAFVLDSHDAEWVAGVVAGWIREDSGWGEKDEVRSARSGWSGDMDEEER